MEPGGYSGGGPRAGARGADRASPAPRRQAGGASMAQEQKLPSEAQFNAFANRLKEFRGGLNKEDQHMLDAMVHAAFKQEGKDDVQGYWWAYPAYPAWY